MSKGSRQRPCDKEKFNKGWNRIWSEPVRYFNENDESNANIDRDWGGPINAKQSKLQKELQTGSEVPRDS